MVIAWWEGNVESWEKMYWDQSTIKKDIENCLMMRRRKIFHYIIRRDFFERIICKKKGLTCKKVFKYAGVVKVNRRKNGEYNEQWLQTQKQKNSTTFMLTLQRETCTKGGEAYGFFFL